MCVLNGCAFIFSYPFLFTARGHRRVKRLYLAIILTPIAPLSPSAVACARGRRHGHALSHRGAARRGHAVLTVPLSPRRTAGRQPLRLGGGRLAARGQHRRPLAHGRDAPCRSIGVYVPSRALLVCVRVFLCPMARRLLTCR